MSTIAVDGLELASAVALPIAEASDVDIAMPEHEAPLPVHHPALPTTPRSPAMSNEQRVTRNAQRELRCGREAIQECVQRGDLQDEQRGGRTLKSPS